ncbi:DUF4097 family beta strand repeat-containing protein [Winogradskyella luteola]|uniref:DUF4097 domain-containing protein n=1 Tax=Winogradskyella luteola TaxID=2828330 RepID=A0A9X1JTK9_9FLAO|nr:DUF4097 family beta strand repeat-containing protein [Winogradskyella luteola]MBV7270727.1 hypothetical protein [Winogradskyella luteola]
MKNKIFTTFALLIITATAFAQDYSMSLKGITKVIISSETTIVVKPHDSITFLMKASENYRNPNAEKSKGLKKISGSGDDNTNYGVEVIKEGTLLIVKGLRERRASNLVIHLPKNMNISVESLANNEIYIDGFSAEVETINHHGETLLANINGPIVAENGNGNITVIFSTLNQLYPMSIVADNGDIDIRMPQDASATIISKTPRGEFYSDFDIEVINESSIQKNKRSVKGKINKGGVEISIQNLKGNIYLRQLK